jgi:hypothetical protein
MVEVDAELAAVTPEETAAVQGLTAGGPMTPEQAAVVLCCWCCRGPVRALPKPWRFRCAGCAITIKPDDIGSLQAAVRRRVAAALAAAVSPAEGIMADGGG